MRPPLPDFITHLILMRRQKESFTAIKVGIKLDSKENVKLFLIRHYKYMNGIVV